MKTYDLPAFRNPLKTRDDVVLWTQQLLEPLKSRYLAGGVGLHLGNASAHYSSRTAAFEGWSRMLWGLAPLVAGGGTYSHLDLHVDGLRHGTNPEHPGYWGEPGAVDQRCVEMAALALGLLLAPQAFWDPLSAEEKHRVWAWLDTINRVNLAENNWQFFRILVNVAFLERGLPHNQVAMDASFVLLDSLVREEGWYADGVNFDYYNPFALHYYGLIYAHYMANRDATRCQFYREQARQFAQQYVCWFHDDGSSIPYGRSLTYRFAVVSFFSACALVEEEVLPWGVMKGIVLRNFRWWSARPMLDHEGLLTVGFAYPDLLVAEQYNSPTSPYWAFKAFLALALPESHAFWQAEEVTLPLAPGAYPQPVPGFVVQKTSYDTVLLCPGRYPPYEVVNNAAKYSKFAYSARLGFCVGHGGYDLEKVGGDSMLLVSTGDGYWRERRHSESLQSGSNWVSSVWRPYQGTSVRTWLIAADEGHVRVHRLETDQEVETAEGGFSAPFSTAMELEPPRAEDEARRKTLDHGTNPYGSVRFEGHSSWSLIVGLASRRRGTVVAPSPNLNLIFPQVRIPTLVGRFKPGVHWLACYVAAGDGEGNGVPRLASVASGVPGLEGLS